MCESSQRLDLIRYSLELRNKELPPQSAKAAELRKELEALSVSSPTPSSSSYVSLQPFKHANEQRDQHANSSGMQGNTPPSSSLTTTTTSSSSTTTAVATAAAAPSHSVTSSSLSLGKSAAITGKLEVRLMGCQDLLEDVPGRSRRDSTHSTPNDFKSLVKGTVFYLIIFFSFHSIPMADELSTFGSGRFVFPTDGSFFFLLGISFSD